MLLLYLVDIISSSQIFKVHPPLPLSLQKKPGKFFLPMPYLWNFSNMVRGGRVTLDMSERLWELEGNSTKVSSSLVAGVRHPRCYIGG